jgi:hypothetical protein
LPKACGVTEMGKLVNDLKVSSLKLERILSIDFFKPSLAGAKLPALLELHCNSKVSS